MSKRSIDTESFPASKKSKEVALKAVQNLENIYKLVGGKFTNGTDYMILKILDQHYGVQKVGENFTEFPFTAKLNKKISVPDNKTWYRLTNPYTLLSTEISRAEETPKVLENATGNFRRLWCLWSSMVNTVVEWKSVPDWAWVEDIKKVVQNMEKNLVLDRSEKRFYWLIMPNNIESFKATEDWKLSFLNAYFDRLFMIGKYCEKVHNYVRPSASSNPKTPQIIKIMEELCSWCYYFGTEKARYYDTNVIQTMCTNMDSVLESTLAKWPCFNWQIGETHKLNNLHFIGRCSPLDSPMHWEWLSRVPNVSYDIGTNTHKNVEHTPDAEEAIYYSKPFLLVGTFNPASATLLLKLLLAENHPGAEKLLMVNSRSNHGEMHPQTVRVAMKEVVHFFKNIEQHFWKKGYFFPPGNLLQRVEPVSNEHNPADFKLCYDSFNPTYIDLQAEPGEKEILTLPVSIYALWMDDPVRNKTCLAQQMWEFGTFLVYFYLLFIPKSVKEFAKRHDLHQFNSQFLSSKDDRMWIFPWIASDAFSMSVSLLFKRDPETRPKSIDEWLEHPATQEWLQFNDFSKTLKKKSEEKKWFAAFSEERKFLRKKMSQWPSRGVDVVQIPTKFKDISEEHAPELIKVLSQSLVVPHNDNFTQRTLRNRFDWYVKFYTKNIVGHKVEMTEDEASGPGVTQEAITMFWQSIEKTKLYTRKNPGTEEEWFLLGLVLSHCLFHEFCFSFSRPRYFFKTVLAGSKAEFDLRDLYEKDPAQAMMFMNMLMKSTEKEIESMEFCFEDLNEPWMKGNITKDTLRFYIKGMTKKLLLDDIPSSCYDALEGGFNLTRSEFPPTEDILHSIFANMPQVTFDILKTSTIVRSRSDENQPSIVHIKHSTDMCFLNDHHMPKNHLCFVSCLKRWLKEGDSKRLATFVQFVKGTPSIGGITDGIVVEVVDIDDPKDYRIPSAHTCIRTFHLHNPCYKEFANQEEVYQYFCSQMDFAMDHVSLFGIL